MKKKLFAAIGSGALVLASLVAAPEAQAVETKQTASCTDGGGHLWKVSTVWGDVYTGSDGKQHVTNDVLNMTTTATDTNEVDYNASSYNADGTRYWTIQVDDKAFDFDSGGVPRYLNQNVGNPIVGSSPVKVALYVGDGNDGFGGCRVEFTQPSDVPADSAAERYGWGAADDGDEFNYTGAPDPAKWSVYNGPGHSDNGVRSPANVTVNGSALDIVGKPDGSTGGMSSRFDREGKSTVAPATDSGRWETRMRVYGSSTSSYRASGYHPVLIVWPDAGRISANGCQELDYSEGTGTVTEVHTYLHYACPNDQVQAVQTIDQRQWHNYAVEWNASHVTTYVDGEVLYTTTNTAYTPNDASHSTIQLDNFLGTLTESHLQVDWARYWVY